MKRMHPRKRLARIIRKLTIDINTAEYWNRLNPTETPLDVEDLRVLLAMGRQCEKSTSARDFERLTRAMAEYATKNCK